MNALPGDRSTLINCTETERIVPTQPDKSPAIPAMQEVDVLITQMIIRTSNTRESASLRMDMRSLSRQLSPSSEEAGNRTSLL
jgi:hypothetical protein